MVHELRQGTAKHGLVLANGGVMTYQHVVCLSSAPRRDGSPYPENPLPEALNSIPAPEIQDEAEGEAIIEVSPSLFPNLQSLSQLV